MSFTKASRRMAVAKEFSLSSRLRYPRRLAETWRGVAYHHGAFGDTPTCQNVCILLSNVSTTALAAPDVGAAVVRIMDAIKVAHGRLPAHRGPGCL